MSEIPEFVFVKFRNFGVHKRPEIPEFPKSGIAITTHRPSGRPTGPRRTALYPNDPEAHIQLIQYVSRRPYIVYSAGGAGGTFTHTR